MNAPKNNRRSQYRSQLPAADKNGNVRPRIGGRRFVVGNVRTESLGEMERRRDALKELFAKQCEELEIDKWQIGFCPTQSRLNVVSDRRSKFASRQRHMTPTVTDLRRKMQRCFHDCGSLVSRLKIEKRFRLLVVDVKLEEVVSQLPIEDRMASVDPFSK